MGRGRFRTIGTHTDEKVQTVQAYAGFFAGALRNQPFRRIYIDAFAGDGTYALDHGDAGLLEGLVRDGVEIKPGSAEFAVAVDPPFDAIYFLEMERRSVDALNAIAARHPNRIIEVRPGDANAALRKLCSEIQWRRNRGARAVLFLDPFGMSVEWSTMEEIAATQAIDVWYLFPTGAVGRQLPHDHRAVDASKEAALNRILGGSWWRDAFYRPVETPPSLFTHIDPVEKRQRDAGFDTIEQAFIDRLKGLFAYVAPKPRQLTSNGVRAFSLMFAMANPDHAAQALARKALRSILPS